MSYRTWKLTTRVILPVLFIGLALASLRTIAVDGATLGLTLVSMIWICLLWLPGTFIKEKNK